MAVSSAQVTCGTGATLLVAADSDGCRVVLHKEKLKTIYVGGSNVTTSNGFLFDHDGTIDISLQAGDKIYACSATGTEIAYVLTIGDDA